MGHHVLRGGIFTYDPYDGNYPRPNLTQIPPPKKLTVKTATNNLLLFGNRLFVSCHYYSYVIKEPLGPEENGPLELDVMRNMDFAEKEVRLKLGWEYESSSVINDIRSINKKQIEKYASLRFNFETYNHDGWVLFG